MRGAKPNPDKHPPLKDRAEHEGRRGVKASKVSDPDGRELTQKDVASLVSAFKSESDRGAALLYAVMVEIGVEWAIYRRMPGLGQTIRKATFSGEKAPLSTFSAKIVMGRAMGIYGEETERLLNGIRSIRNKFAHTFLALDFKTPAIAAHCNALRIPGGLIPLPKNDSPRRRYELAANWTYARLMENAISQTASFNIDLP